MSVTRKPRLNRGIFRYKKGSGLQLVGPLEILDDGSTDADLSVAGDVTVTGTISSTGGSLPTQDAVTATVDGLTTGLIGSAADFAIVTSANADHIITLPASSTALIGKIIRGWVGANGCEMRTPAASGATINAVDSDGTNEAAIPATTLFQVELVAANTWILTAFTELGALISAIVPDAA